MDAENEKERDLVIELQAQNIHVQEEHIASLSKDVLLYKDQIAFLKTNLAEYQTKEQERKATHRSWARTLGMAFWGLIALVIINALFCETEQQRNAKDAARSAREGFSPTE